MSDACEDGGQLDGSMSKPSSCAVSASAAMAHHDGPMPRYMLPPAVGFSSLDAIIFERAAAGVAVFVIGIGFGDAPVGGIEFKGGRSAQAQASRHPPATAWRPHNNPGGRRAYGLGRPQFPAP